MSLTDKLQDLINAKADMKAAIESKGVEVTGGMSTYADAIRSIESGGSDGGFKILNGMKLGYSTWEKLPLLDTGHLTDMSSMFINCANLIDISAINIDSATDISYMLFNCESLTTVPLLDTSKVENMSGLFNGCTSLTTVPLLDTSSVTSMLSMFDSCTSLTTVPLLDTSKVETTAAMFYRCTSLTTVPSFDTENVMQSYLMFYGCTSLTTVPSLDASNVVNAYGMFKDCTAVTTISGLKNFGKSIARYTTNETACKEMFKGCPNITRQSSINIFNNLYDRKAAGYSVLTLQFEPEVIARLTSDDIAIATNKGWTVSS